MVNYEIHLYLIVAYSLDQLKTTDDSKALPKIVIPQALEVKNLPNWHVQSTENGSRLLNTKKLTEHASPLLVDYYTKNNSIKFEKATDSPGSCMLCHSRINEENIKNWTSPPPTKKLTKFSHLPHSSDCASCHKFKEDKTQTILNLFPSYQKDFQPMTKQTCFECHSRRGAGDHCLDCHNYHSTDPDQFKSNMIRLLESYK